MPAGGAAGGAEDQKAFRQQILKDLMDQIATQGLKVGNNWQIMQVGDNLWVQNFFNQSAAQQNQTNQTQPSELVINETMPSGNESD